MNIKDAELRALQAQINPHFFFNSLNTIRALVYQDPDAAAGAIGKLAGMMRHSLQAGQSETVRLADEMRAVEAYLSMEKLRFEDRMQVDIQIEKGLEEMALPPMMLQTLVENAVKHGVERSMVLCKIKIDATRHDESVVLRVANQGQLKLTSTSTQIGLSNTSKRLALKIEVPGGISLAAVGCAAGEYPCSGYYVSGREQGLADGHEGAFRGALAVLGQEHADLELPPAEPPEHQRSPGDTAAAPRSKAETQGLGVACTLVMGGPARFARC